MQATYARWRWPLAYALAALVATTLTWTVLRPHLYLTDGIETARDPFTPLGVALVNAFLVTVALAAVRLVHFIVALSRIRSPKP